MSRPRWTPVDLGDHDTDTLRARGHVEAVECGHCGRRFTGDLARARAVSHWRLAHAGPVQIHTPTPDRSTHT